MEDGDYAPSSPAWLGSFCALSERLVGQGI